VITDSASAPMAGPRTRPRWIRGLRAANARLGLLQRASEPLWSADASSAGPYPTTRQNLVGMDGLGDPDKSEGMRGSTYNRLTDLAAAFARRLEDRAECGVEFPLRKGQMCRGSAYYGRCRKESLKFLSARIQS